MKLISHRGNIRGRHPDLENDPAYIKQDLSLGYDVEIDVGKINGNWFLGHDDPSYPIYLNFLMNPKLLCHAKNLSALDGMLVHTNIHCFYHADDPYTLTSGGYIVSYPGYEVTNRTICMKPELARPNLNCYAICSDYVELFKKMDTGSVSVGFNETR